MSQYMQVFNSLTEITEPFKNAVVTIGNFDGVHLGHQALLRETVKRTQELHGTAVAITFTPHPVDFFHRKHRPYILTPIDEKLDLMARLGLDAVVNIPFTQEFTQTAARDFLVKILMQTIGMRAIVVGKDYSFGRNREGTLMMLEEEAPELGYEVVVVDWVSLKDYYDRQISSSAIREMIRHADVTAAACMLGRPFRLQGPIVHGDNRGRTVLDIPTANLDITNQLYPPKGIYAGFAEIEGKRHMAAIYIGAPQTFNADNMRVEAHLLDMPAGVDLYGKTIKIDFIKFLRDEIKFNDSHNLKQQILQDIDNIRQILSEPLTCLVDKP